MPNWNDVLVEIQRSRRIDALDFVRKKYLKLLHKKTNRNVIAYYSGFLQRSNPNHLSINDSDKNALMNAVHGLDRTKGLDLILHTPGGDIAATESIVDYLWKMFDKDIRAIIPQIAMSGGTMIACASREILMGKQSNLGPIDPQFGGIPVYGVIEEFERAISEIRSDPAKIPVWQVIIGKYHPTFIGECEKAIKWSNEIVLKWLSENMFSDVDPKQRKLLAERIVTELSDHSQTRTHSRHIPMDQCQNMGLKITSMEDDNKLQDLILTVHHSYMHTFANSTCIKIVENHLGRAMILNETITPQFIGTAQPTP
jgi:hypothetical protein